MGRQLTDQTFGFNTQSSASTPQHAARHSFYYSFPAGNWVNVLKPKQTKNSQPINNNSRTEKGRKGVRSQIPFGGHREIRIHESDSTTVSSHCVLQPKCWSARHLPTSITPLRYGSAHLCLPVIHNVVRVNDSITFAYNIPVLAWLKAWLIVILSVAFCKLFLCLCFTLPWAAVRVFLLHT